MQKVRLIICLFISAILSVSSLTLSSYAHDDHDLWKDALMRIVEYGDGEQHILENYTPQNSIPMVGYTDLYNLDGIPACELDCSKIKDDCHKCGEQLIYCDILYARNPNCGHGIFAMGYYCKEDRTFTPDVFYDQCGCYLHGVNEVEDFLEFKP